MSSSGVILLVLVALFESLICCCSFHSIKTNTHQMRCAFAVSGVATVLVSWCFLQLPPFGQDWVASILEIQTGQAYQHGTCSVIHYADSCMGQSVVMNFAWNDLGSNLCSFRKPVPYISAQTSLQGCCENKTRNPKHTPICSLERGLYR